MGVLWSNRYRPMRVFPTISTTLFIGVPLRAATLVVTGRGVNRKNGENSIGLLILFKQIVNRTGQAYPENQAESKKV